MEYSVPIDRSGGALSYLPLKRKEINDSTVINSSVYLNSLVIGIVRTKYEAGSKPVAVEMAQFASSNDAYGFFSQVRPNGVTPVEGMVAESYFKDDTLRFTKADYVVTVSSKADTNRTETILNIGKKIDSSLAIKTRPPQFFLLFPYKGQVVGSYKYYSINLMGIDGLDNVYTVDYQVDKDLMTLFLTMDTSGSKLIMLNDWGEKHATINSVPTEFDFLGSNVKSFTHPEQGQIVAGMVSNKLAGVIGYKRDSGVQLVPRWMQGIQ